MRGRLTYANVTSTLALFVALGGGAYAVSNVGSGDVKDNSIRSIDLKDRHGVKGRDVTRNGLGGREIDESSLNASRIARVGGANGSDCNPDSPTTFIDCVATPVRLSATGRILVIATGGEESLSMAAKAACRVEADSHPISFEANPGESASINTDSTATNGFARTGVSEILDKGRHVIALACKELAGDVRIDAPTIAVIAINEPR